MPLRKKKLFFHIFIYFSPKIVENFFLSKSGSSYLKTKKKKEKKVPMATKPRGGGVKALVVGPLRKELFLRLP